MQRHGLLKQLVTNRLQKANNQCDEEASRYLGTLTRS